MARQTTVVLLLILATVANLCEMVKAQSAHDFDRIVREANNCGHRDGHGCPSGWVRYGARCYKYQSGSTDWASAEKNCLALGGHLVSIHSENEYQLVKAVIRANDPRENPTWIGLTGCQKTNNFFWSDGTKLIFTKWNPGEPNFVGGAEGCVHMNWPSTKNWNDIPCGFNYPSVCTRSIN